MAGSVMAALIKPTLDVAQAVSEIVGLPFLGGAISLVASIQDNCERVAAHKADCRRLAGKAAHLLDTFQQQLPRLNESELRTYADEVENALAKVHGRTSRWASYGVIQAFFRDSKIEAGIKQCESDLDSALASFQVNATVHMNFNQEQLTTIVLNHGEHLKEILVLLRDPKAISQIAEIQKTRSEPIAQVLIEAGQEQLKVLREQNSQGSSSQPPHNPEYEETQRGVLQLYNLTGIPPKVRNLDGEVTRPDELPYVGGTYCDVWIGYWLGDQKVALKTMRGVTNTSDKAKHRFSREMKVWAELSHPHILPFLGIITNIGHFVNMVSPWQANGNILDYIRKYERADRLHLLSGAADGAAYLHSKGVVHGNIRCGNILVAIGGEAVICDFGVAKVREDITAQSATMTLTTQGSARWMAPELLDATITSPTTMCDVYSLSMTMLECFTLQHPFFEVKREIHVITKMSKGNLTPDRPTAEDAQKWIAGGTWELMAECWNRSPEQRPKMREVADRLMAIENNLREAKSSLRSTVGSPVSGSQPEASGSSTPLSG